MLSVRIVKILRGKNELPFSYEVAFSGTLVPEGVAKGFRNKTKSLVSDTHTISPAPRCCPRDKMVISKSGLAPQLGVVMTSVYIHSR